ncbi:LysE family translocator [Acinetobacter sp. WZC-1]|uniref:LysE family translocator n=1 Tax=Acinetobacter sp. WZC-1 TaxID=3459034 RepID=UPI00403DA545
MSEMTAVVLIILLAVISPGADFAIVSNNSYFFGRKSAILTSTGIALGVWIHVSYTLIFLYFAVHALPEIVTVIQYLGAAYLIYLAWQTYHRKPAQYDRQGQCMNNRQAFMQGLLVNALNPKTALFVISLFTQMISPSASVLTLVAYGLFISLAHLGWFSLVSLLFSAQPVRTKILCHQQKMNQMTGLCLGVLGCLLLLHDF